MEKKPKYHTYFSIEFGKNNLSQLFGNAFLHFFKIIAMYDDVSTIKDFIFDKNQGNFVQKNFHGKFHFF